MREAFLGTVVFSCACRPSQRSSEDRGNDNGDAEGDHVNGEKKVSKEKVSKETKKDKVKATCCEERNRKVEMLVVEYLYHRKDRCHAVL